MHRLVLRFIVNEIERGSRLWNEVYSFALVSVHETVEKELEMVGKSFEQLPVVFNNNQREIAAHAIALVHHHTLPAEGAQIRNVSQVEDMHWYSGKAMKSLGRVEEEVQVWEGLVNVLEHRQVPDQSKSNSQSLLDVRTDRESRVAAANDSLGMAFMRNGRLNDATAKLENSLKMRLAIHGPDKPHSDIALSLNNLGLMYEAMGNSDKTLEKYEKSLQMGHAIHDRTNRTLISRYRSTTLDYCMKPWET